MKITVWIIVVTVGVALLVGKSRKHRKENEKKNSIYESSHLEETNLIKTTAYSDNLMNKYEQLRELKKQGENKEAIKLALQLVEETEAENEQLSWGVAPAPYRELAILYRKEKDPTAELLILERYFSQTLAPGQSKYTLMDRYLKLSEKEGHQIPEHISLVFLNLRNGKN